MNKYILSPKAERDVRQIWKNIAPENETAADNLLLRLFDKFELFSHHPNMGVARPELSKTARIMIEGNYIAIYEPQPYGIYVISVVDGGRHMDNWL